MRRGEIPILCGAAVLSVMIACSPPAGSPAVAGGSSASGAEAATVLPFVENDYALALDRARRANLPLFVEVWAPW